MVLTLKLEIAPMLSMIAEVKTRIASAMIGSKKSSIDSTSMVATELLENAIKYGVVNNHIPQVGLDFELADDIVSIKVKNGVEESESLEKLKKTMKKICESENKKALYLDRLQEIIDNPSKHASHLGLYRIVSKGEFDLKFHIQGDVLEITATKKIREK
jgi:hypothetical protein